MKLRTTLRASVLRVAAGLALGSVLAGGAGCSGGGWGGGGGEVLVVRPRAGWQRQAIEARAEYRPPDLRQDALAAGGVGNAGGGVEVRPRRVKMTDTQQLSMGGLIEGRRIVGEVAREAGLSARPPTDREQADRWTEVYEGPGGNIAVREERMGRWMEVRVGGREAGKLRATLRERLGIAELG